MAIEKPVPNHPDMKALGESIVHANIWLHKRTIEIYSRRTN
jgi:hypothetical protein